MTDEALIQFNNAIKYGYNLEYAYNSIAVIYYMKNDLEKARENWEKVIVVNPKNLDAINNVKAISIE